MRSNLLSLRETAKLQDLTQARLASGLKTASAIDNPSAYYTANELNSRAQDLSALLDSMGQAVSTIKAAAETLDTAAGFLQQLSSVASQAVDRAVGKKEVSTEILKEKGILVASDKAELKTRMASARAGDTVIVMGTVEMGDESLTVPAGVTLAGAAYAVDKYGLSGQFKAENKAVINFDRLSTTEAKGIVMSSGSTLSDLEVNLSSEYTGTEGGAVHISRAAGVVLRNLDLSVKSGRAANNNFYGAITNSKDAVTELQGKINIKTSGGSISGISQQRYYNIATMYIAKGAEINIETSGARSGGIAYGNVYSEGNIRIKTTGSLSHGIEVESISAFGGNVDIYISGSANAIKEKLNILGSARFMLRNENAPSFNGSVSVKAGAVIGRYQNNRYKVYDSLNDNTVTSATNFETSADYKVSSYSYEQFLADLSKEEESSAEAETDYYVPDSYNTPYNDILNQFDQLIQDGGYKGVNLLLENSLKVNFNENRTTGIEIAGKNASSEGLGIKAADWKTLKDVESSLKEISSAISEVRSMTADFGNYYSILTTRKNFTENLINILQEGADKLVLADMNEESANMLALETRQQLAVNSLSLSSQASQAVLKLF